jgi:hypothetical protein
MDEKAKEVIEGWNRADADRGTWKNHWQQITELCLPERNDYTVERAPGMKRNQSIFNETPEFALTQFANGLHSLLTSPTLQWFQLHCDDDRLNQMRDVRLWFDVVTEVMYGYFNGPKHNFASQSHEYYLDLGSIGTANMAVLEHKDAHILFSTRHMKECVFWENEEDRVDKLTRRWKWTPKQAVESGLEVGPNTMKAYRDNSDKKLVFYHSVAPRKIRNIDRTDAKHKAFESIYVSEEDGIIVGEGGFDEFPYLPGRLSKTAGEIYGRGPGMTMLPLMKMLNEATKMVIKAAQKIVDPPLQSPDDGYLLPIKTVPGSQNFYRSNAPQTARITPIETKGRIDIGDDMLARMEQKIMRGFYVEWMMMPSDPTDPASSGKGITATYVLQQRDEKMRLLSPMLARLQSEFLGPLIDRTFAILMRRSMAKKFGPDSPFPLPPAVLQGQQWHVEYLSPIAIAQRSSQLDSVGRLMAVQMQIKQADPNSPTIMDYEQVMRITGKDLNAPTIVLKSAEQLAQEAAAQQQMIAQQHQAEMRATDASAMKDGTGAAKNMADVQAANAA